MYGAPQRDHAFLNGKRPVLESDRCRQGLIDRNLGAGRIAADPAYSGRITKRQAF
jgi:hypothetical protein